MGVTTFVLVALLAFATFLIGRIDQFTPGLLVAVAGISGVALAVAAALAAAEYLGTKELDQARVELLALQAETDHADGVAEARLHDARAIILALGAALHALERQGADQATTEAIASQLAHLRELLSPAPEAPLEAIPVSDITAEVRSIALLCGVTVEIDLPAAATVLGTRAGVARILHNLLDNARKYASGSVLRVGCEPAGPYLRLTVEDDGPGIAEADPEALFLPGVRGREAAQGYGMGLAAARRAAERMQGALWYERRPGAGSRFVLKLPRSQPEAGEPG